MLRSLELLVLGRRVVPKHFREARKRWLQIYAEEKNSSIETLAQRLSSEQMWFESNCGGHHFGQEVMVWASLATFYSIRTGWRPSRKKFAQRLVSAFDKSFCSIEVKFRIIDAAKSYNLQGEHGYQGAAV